MNPKRKLDLIAPITKTQANFQIAMLEAINRLASEVRDNNQFLKDIYFSDKLSSPFSKINPNNTHQMRKNAGLTFHPIQKNHFPEIKPRDTNIEVQQDVNCLKQALSPIKKIESSLKLDKQQQTPLIQSQIQNESVMVNVMAQLKNSLLDIADVNRKIYDKLLKEHENNKEITAVDANFLGKELSLHKQEYESILLNAINKKTQKKSYNSYGIISQIMPYSDKREIKVRYKIADLIEKNDLTEKQIPFNELKLKTTEWVGMIFRATASICWNMLLGNQLNFDEVKVLFTENIIYNFIEYMNDIEFYIEEQKRLELAHHINSVSCEVLEFLCRQYPQTKVEAPNVALRKAIPRIENQGQSKFDLVAMATKDTSSNEEDRIYFQIREDKDYSTMIMKTINYMIDQTESQYDHFHDVMTNIFQKIYLQKENRKMYKGFEPIPESIRGDSNHRQKVKAYSSYLIGRKIPKNTPKYNHKQIQYGVFFVKSPSTLRIITKWLEQLWDFVNAPLQQLKNSNNQIKDHNGKVLNISTRIKHLLFETLAERVQTIQSKIEKLKVQCYNMELLLTSQTYTSDDKQMHLSQQQLGVGKYCSNLKNAISSYVCFQLSKIIHYLLEIPKQIDETVLGFSDEDFQEQARKHLESTNLVTLRIFDLLRCKCHSNEEEIIYIVQALKQFAKCDQKFELVRVKDRLSQGTRDILINAQYGGLVWEIQLAVTSHTDKKQELLDLYNHFLYQLKRSKLGPISECVSIWSSLEQRSIYFEQLNLNRTGKVTKCKLDHAKQNKQCLENSIKDFTEFKRPIICKGCKQYYAIPLTSLLNTRCEICKITYCGLCFYQSLDVVDKKAFMFQNFSSKKLMNSAAFKELVQYTDYKQPFPKEGFFIKKLFLNRELSYFKVIKIDQDSDKPDLYEICLSQVIIRSKQIDTRRINKTSIMVKIENGEYYIQATEKQIKSSGLSNNWIYYFKNTKSEDVELNDLCLELKDPAKANMKYLCCLFEPNYMNELKVFHKVFDKNRLIHMLKDVQNIQSYKIAVHRFPKFTILSRLQVSEQQLKETLVKKANRSKLKQFIEKKVTIINMEQQDLTDEIETLAIIPNEDIFFYFTKVQKLYLADNKITNIGFISLLSNLQSLSISKNYLKSLNGVEELYKLVYIKFDENEIVSLKELTGLTSLTYVSCNLNQIDSLQGLQNLTNLGSLSICTNRLKDVTQLKNLPNLTRIYLRDNPIDNIACLQSSHINHLYIGNTLINPINLGQMHFIDKLKEISFKDMKLTSIPNIFQNASNLTELKLNKNKIVKIQNLQNAISMLRLDLSDNQIAVMQNLAELSNLEVLNLRNNQIRVVEQVKYFAESLKLLYLEKNPLEDVSAYLFYEEKTLLQMRLKYSEDTISAKAKDQINNHAIEINSKSESDD